METNNPLANLSGAQLRRAADIRERIEELTRELEQVLSGGNAAPRRGRPPGSGGGAAKNNNGGGGAGGKRRQMSPEGRARIAAAARARWAKVRAEKATRK